MPQSVDPANTRPHTIPRVDLTKLPNYLLQPALTLDPQEQADVSSNPPCHCQLDVGISAIIADDPTVDELVAYYRAASGEHENWDEYRAAMVADRRVIVRLSPDRAYGMV